MNEADAQGYHWTFGDHSHIGHALAERGVYEPTGTEAVVRLVKPGQTFVDVGANIGYYSLIAAMAMKGDGQVDAYEPDPANSRFLNENIMANGIDDIVSPYRVALSNERGTLPLCFCKKNDGDHRVYESDESREVIQVPAFKGDDIYKNEQVDFIKCDVQGWDGFVLDGFKRVIERSDRLIIMVEFWPWGLNASGYGAEAFLNRLEGFGFSMHTMSRGKTLIKPADSRDLHKFAKMSDHWAYTNLLCLKDGWGIE